MSDELSAESASHRRWRKWKRVVGLVVAVLVAVRVVAALIPARLEIGPETTVIDGPLRDDGSIDYAAALNNEWGAGVTPDQNAVVDLLRAFGPGIIDEEIRDAYFARLGIPIPPLAGDYPVVFREFLEAQGMTWQDDSERIEELEAQFASAKERPWTSDEFPEVAAWLQANQQPLQAILDASRRPRLYSPIIEPIEGGLLSARNDIIFEARRPARLLMTASMFELGRGDVARASELTLACHRLSRLVAEARSLIGQFVAYALCSMVCRGDEAIVLSASLSADQAALNRQLLAALQPVQSMRQTLDGGERFIGLDYLIAMYSGRISDEEGPNGQSIRTNFDPNPILRRWNEVYDQVDAAFALPDRAARIDALRDLHDRLSTTSRPNFVMLFLGKLAGSRAIISQQIGDMLVSLLVPAFEGTANAEYRTEIRLFLVNIGYALAEYSAKNGEFPESLDGLVPVYVDAVPIDTFNGEPLKYQRTDDGFLLYSVGENGVDDGGIMDRKLNADDIAFGDRPDLVTDVQ